MPSNRFFSKGMNVLFNWSLIITRIPKSTTFMWPLSPNAQLTSTS
jgi:hypothetical protein